MAKKQPHKKPSKKTENAAGPKQDPGPTGGEMAAKLTPEEQKALPPTRQANGQLHGQPGSNGGVQRGPDLKPRLFIPSVLLMAFTDEGELALPPASKRSGAAKRKRAKALHAATYNAATMVKRVMLDAAEGDDVATGHAIRILGLTHETLQPTKHEAAKGGQGPILPKFKRYDPSEDPNASPARLEPASQEPPGTKLVDKDGTEYVEGGRLQRAGVRANGFYGRRTGQSTRVTGYRPADGRPLSRSDHPAAIATTGALPVSHLEAVNSAQAKRDHGDDGAGQGHRRCDAVRADESWGGLDDFADGRPHHRTHRGRDSSAPRQRPQWKLRPRCPPLSTSGPWISQTN